MSENGCVAVSDQCRTFNEDGFCTSCYKGYKLEDGICRIEDINNQPSDFGCAEWDWDNQICLKCSFRFIQTDSGCTPVSDNCASFNDQGDCTECYKGFEISQGECIVSQIFNNQAPFDLGCAEWDWDNQVCLKCSFRFVMTDQGCVKVSDSCNTFDDEGRCTSCFLGYRLNGGIC